MKTQSSKQPWRHGSVLILTLTLGVILLLASINYLMLVGTQKTVVTRAQTWNAALTMAEAGVEEAMAQVNSQVIFNDYTAFTVFTNINLAPQDFSNNGWGTVKSSFGPMSRKLAGGSYGVTITTNDVTPTLYATGYVTVPISGDSIARSVKVTTAVARLSNIGLGAVQQIDLNGNIIAVDSWNSHDVALSTDGAYDASKTSTNGDVASVGGLVNVGNETIEGNLYLGPNATYKNSNGDVTGTTYTDFNVQFPDVVLPTGASGWALATPVTQSTYKTNGSGVVTASPFQVYDFTSSGNYILNNGTYPIVVETGVTVALNVTATSFDPGSIEIHGGTVNSGTAVFYLNGPSSLALSGNTAVDASNRPENLWFFGLPSLTAITWGGSSDFVGVIYAPEADIKLNGGGNTIYDIMGSIVGKSVTTDGHFRIHYDQYLSNIGPIRGFVAASWQEL